ncbi:Hypothetical protein CAP_6093 [Chondromyces apiculatus DSM 436]|uniref:Uncharacterized protein n=1 Tax=Chondromyces apiculatus DSM 436 TaxID=1192034 RepID=A0A017THD7_9BACT|nr:Hypothetical protein CAP_6093 [Chondromyces apiculatus DSM 436]
MSGSSRRSRNASPSPEHASRAPRRYGHQARDGVQQEEAKTRPGKDEAMAGFGGWMMEKGQEGG